MSFRSKILLLVILSSCLIAQGQELFRFRVFLSDKGNVTPSISAPETFLSTNALARRCMQNIPIDKSDLPVSKLYLSQLRKAGAEVIVVSRWLNTAVIELNDSADIAKIKKFPFVEKTQFVWKNTSPQSFYFSSSLFDSVSPLPPLSYYTPYGYSYCQLQKHNIPQLHSAGYRGEGMRIAVIDGGFRYADVNQLIPASSIKEVKDFTGGEDPPLRSSSHGSEVLSVMAANKAGEYIGSAPHAQYWLFRTEEDRSEFPIEEDYWVAAAEYADSVGVDIITTSLGYSRFDNEELDYATTQLDGKTSFVSRGAACAAQKGILVVCSAGNEKGKGWERIIFPADVPDVLTVGANERDGRPSTFSGLGYNANGDIKPDVVALGTEVYIVDAMGRVITSDGSSYSTPIMAGAAACLWQSLPHCSAQQIIRLMRENASHFSSPNEDRGYGETDIYQAMIQGQTLLKQKEYTPGFAYRKSEQGGYLVATDNMEKEGGSVCVYNATGSIVKRFELRNENSAFRLPPMEDGLYCAVLYNGERKKILFFDLKNG